MKIAKCKMQIGGKSIDPAGRRLENLRYKRQRLECLRYKRQKVIVLGAKGNILSIAHTFTMGERGTK